MAQRLTDDVGLQLLENAIATAAALTALILAFGPVSGAHFNPAVTLVDRWLGGMDTRSAVLYISVQVLGGAAGVILANGMFDLPAIELATKDRASVSAFLSEVVATLGLLLVIFVMVRTGKTGQVAYAVGGYIAGAYWFTASTSFANPAVTLARTLSDTFAGIRPASAPLFLAAQLVGAGLAIPLVRILVPEATAGKGDHPGAD